MGTDVTLLHRFVVSELVTAGLDHGWLLHECDIPDWTLRGPGVHLPSATFARLWEVGSGRLGDPEVPLHIGNRYRLKAAELFDFLFATAATVGAGLATCGPYITAVSTNHSAELTFDGGAEATVALDIIDGVGRGRDLVQLWGLSAMLARTRRVVEGPLDPVRVTLRQRAPRDTRCYAEVFGTTKLEFGADTDAMTFRAVDLDRPLTTADPMLAQVLRPLAETLPPPPELPAAWPRRVATALHEAVADGEVSLEVVARRLAISPRTLQRRLADAGTSWRHELDRAHRAGAGR
ncbi:AraC family transcriptional regulator ligand-binding domain-containing protein [Nocardia sp. alder85J]|uniref:AraC family transcriptional regulator ligand-binding domain-containing protein n=1 Tax=Nocardia sp. alder85J TaxID=2862949 RepID=UPI001CD34527|nr:AraC family transcriptional regulator ligand-binding domain-containing protein [Nocardia sp. alder85J]MCX4097033.1 AraC family transcriptional regulator ligand-binding domain-containing protein [Nocardia sp. alder85J]